MRRVMVALTAAILAIALAAGTALATPGGPWRASEVPCTTASGASGHIWTNGNTGKEHCFAD